ncbi:MAG: hypothetical protein ABR567_05865 [Myxococcales bacterium]|nr:hypothetical protein [Myxococcales bacterium]
MDVRFEDHPQFQRAAGLAALGGGALAAVAPHLALAPAAVVGSAFAIALAPGVVREARNRRVAAAVACLLAAGASILQPKASWLLPLCGAMLGVLFAIARNDSAKSNGARSPSGFTIALAGALGAGAVILASLALSPLATALAALVPGWIATGISGAAFGLWAGLAAVPLHVTAGGDAVELRLAALRASLGSDVRALAERAAAARRGAADELSPGTRADLRSLIDQLALAALDVAERTASLTRASSPALEEDLTKRSAQLAKSAAETPDPAARQSYQRAAEALEGQLDHFRRVRLARERAMARLHEDVANLERARFSLTLLRGPDCAAELDLLHERLQHGAIAFEELEVAPVRVRA